MTSPDSTNELLRLREELARVRQERDDFEIAFTTAIEHGDAIEEQLVAINDQLKDEILERALVETRLQSLLNHINQQKDDLEVVVSTITEHGDHMDSHWLERFTRVEKMSLIDGLTQIANRRAFDTVLRKEWYRCQRSTQPFGMIICDLDFFKLFNDRYGHQQGDDCLVRVAAVLAGCCQRPFDLAARYGGEEFALLLPQTDAAGVQDVAKGLRQRLLELALPHAGSPHGIVTLSQGGAVIVPRLGLAPIELVVEADRQLYIAKREGRDTFRIVDSPL